MIKKIQILLFFIALWQPLYSNISLPDACESYGEDSSFEYIEQITIGHITNISGNNGGYSDYTDQLITVELGSFQDIELVPGYASNPYKEGWNIWIDYNKDGYFDNETEKVFSKIEIGTISSTIRITDNPNHTGLTRMRISMQYVNGAEPCENVTFGEVEDYYVDIRNAETIEPCRVLSFDDFDDGYGNWEDGGSDCSLINRNTQTDNWSIRLRDNSASSTLTSRTLDLSIYNELNITFKYEAYSMEVGEDFWLQLSFDDGITYTTIRKWSSGVEFINEKKYNEEITLKDIQLTDAVKIRWRCDATANADQIYLDNITVNACYYNPEENDVVLPILSDLSSANDHSINNQQSNRNEGNSLNFSVFPNPSSDILTFSIKERHLTSTHNLRVSLTNIHGQSIKNIDINNFQNVYQIDVSQFEKGMYLLKLYNKNQILESTKVMIIR